MKYPPHPFAFVFVFVFGTVVGLTACSAQIDDARAAYRTGKYDEAVDIFRRAASRDSTSVDAWKGLALSLNQVGNYSEAEQQLKRAPR